MVENEIAVASPRISGTEDEDEESFSFTERKASMSPPQIWKENISGESGAAIAMNDSNADIAEAVALRKPYLSQLRYLK